MPLYEYECTQCHRHTEKIQKFSDTEITVCPHCGGPLERTLTAPNVQFKGGGWYKDLYSSVKPPVANGGAGGEAGAAAAASSEAGPATPKDSGSAANSTANSASASAAAPAAAPAPAVATASKS
jgi:putative FmdB family regulatory protein